MSAVRNAVQAAIQVLPRQQKFVLSAVGGTVVDVLDQLKNNGEISAADYESLGADLASWFTGVNHARAKQLAGQMEVPPVQ